MSQAIHIFLKDARHLRYEIALVIVLAFFAQVLWPFAAAYLIARAVHAEPIPGSDQFWITRPYRRMSLLGAKLIFIAAFISIPMLLVQGFWAFRAGFPVSGFWAGLLWQQLLLLVGICLPAAALAAISPGLVVFLFSELVLVTLYLGLHQFWSLGLFKIRPAWPAGVQWIPNSMMVALAAVAAVLILQLQYRRRKTLVSTAIVVTVVLLSAGLVGLFPPEVALKAETLITNSQSDMRGIRLERGGRPDFALQMNQPKRSVKVWMALHPVPAGVSVKVDGFSGELVAADGQTAPVFLGAADIHSRAGGEWLVQSNLFPGTPFFEEHRNQKVTVRGTLYFSIFGNEESQTIPPQARPLTVLNRLRCSTGSFENLVETRCMSAFRWPGEMVYAEVRENELVPFQESISYSPFPAGLEDSTFESHSAVRGRGLAPPSPLGPQPDPPIRIVVRRPLAHLQRDLRFEGVVLTDQEYDVRRAGPPPKKP